MKAAAAAELPAGTPWPSNRSRESGCPDGIDRGEMEIQGQAAHAVFKAGVTPAPIRR